MLKVKLQTLMLVLFYPGAMYVMEGFLKGLPNVLSGTSYEFLKQQVGYFVRIRVNKLNKPLGFPLTSKLNEESCVRDFIDEMDDGIVCIGNVGLEEII